MNQMNPDADPERTPGHRPGEGVPPGETPPAEGSIAEAVPEGKYNPTKGWAKGPTIIILCLVVLFVAFCLAFAATV